MGVITLGISLSINFSSNYFLFHPRSLLYIYCMLFLEQLRSVQLTEKLSHVKEVGGLSVEHPEGTKSSSHLQNKSSAFDLRSYIAPLESILHHYNSCFYRLL
jgi:hypothetical protein